MFIDALAYYDFSKDCKSLVTFGDGKGMPCTQWRYEALRLVHKLGLSLRLRLKNLLVLLAFLCQSKLDSIDHTVSKYTGNYAHRLDV